MTMPRVQPVRTVRCPRCDGTGEVEIGRIRDDLSYRSATCGACGGIGTVEYTEPAASGNQREEAV